MLQVIEAYPPTNHGVMTSLLAGARVHRLDCAHGSIELASPSRAHGAWSEVWLPACQQGGATNRARSSGGRRATLLQGASLRSGRRCSSVSAWDYTMSSRAQPGEQTSPNASSPLHSTLPLPVHLNKVYLWVHAFQGLNKLELHLCLGIVESMLYVVLLTSRAGPYISGAWGKTKFWALTQKISSI
jgi:hypothetical protein